MENLVINDTVDSEIGKIIQVSEVDELLLTEKQTASSLVQPKKLGEYKTGKLIVFPSQGVGVLHKNKFFMLSLADVVKLAVKANLFEEVSANGK